MLELLPDARRRSSQPSPEPSPDRAAAVAVTSAPATSTFLSPADATRANGAAVPVPEALLCVYPARSPADVPRSPLDVARPFIDRARSPLGLSKPVHLGKPVDIPRPPIDIPKSPLGNPKPPGGLPRRLETFKPYPDPPKPPSELLVPPAPNVVTPLPDVCTTPAKPLLDIVKSNQDITDSSPDIAKTPKPPLPKPPPPAPPCEIPKPPPPNKSPLSSARLLLELSRTVPPAPPPRSPSVPPLPLSRAPEVKSSEEIIWYEKISLPIPKTVRPTSPVKDVPSSKHSSPSRNLVQTVDIKPKPLRKEIFVGGGSCKELSRPLSAERSSFRGSREGCKFSTLPKPTRHLSRSSTPQPGSRPKSVAFALEGDGETPHTTSLSILCAASSGDGQGFDTIVKIPAALLLSGKSLVIGSQEEYFERHQACCGAGLGGMGASGGAGAGARAAAADAAESCGGGACRKLLSSRRHQTQQQQQAPPPPPPRDPAQYCQQPQPPGGGIPGGGGAGGTGPGPGLSLPGPAACGSQSNRSQPAIGLKQTPKARPTIFGTVASDQTPKDGSSRRSLPQTPQSAKGFSALLNGGAAGEHGSSAESVPEAGADDHSLVYRDGGNLVAGSLEALVRHMVPTAEYYPDRAYLFAFLLSSRLFIKPHELLGEVCAVCEAQQKLGERSPAAKERLGRFIPHLVQLLAEWTETFPYDFRDERVMAHVRSITQKCVTAEPGIRKEVSTLLQNLLHRLTTLEKYEEFLQRVNAESSTNSVENLSPVDVTELCPSPTLLAQQLTHIELERLSYIGPEEFVQAFAKDNPHLETSFKDMKKTRNLESYVQWFNRLSYFVATEVCKHVKKKQRVKVMEFWIEAARECFNIGNFNSLMAIIAGLNMSPISRLKKTWSKVQQAKFSILEHQMDPSSNFSSYRSTLKAAMWRSAGATDERQRIVIPFFSLLVKDIYFLNEGCSNKLPNGHINFEKFWQLAKQVTEFITWKQVTCPFEKNTKVITFLQASPVLTENALALASFECEPPENNHEKERYKSLKSELNS